MRRVADSELEEMRARGYDPATIEEARMALARTRLADALIDRIAEAFRGVVLGEGIGLREGQGLDDYADEATCAAYRAADEKEDWRKIPADALNHCHSSLCFFDAAGMRFHLPAFLTAELCGEFHQGMDFCLVHMAGSDPSRFSALDERQRQVVREFLLFLRDDPDHVIGRPAIERALAEIWT